MSYWRALLAEEVQNEEARLQFHHQTWKEYFIPFFFNIKLTNYLFLFILTLYYLMTFLNFYDVNLWIRQDDYRFSEL